MGPWDFLQEKPLKNKITVGYTSVFTASVLKASSKFETVREDSFIDFVWTNIFLTSSHLLEKREPQKSSSDRGLHSCVQGEWTWAKTPSKLYSQELR